MTEPTPADEPSEDDDSGHTWRRPSHPDGGEERMGGGGEPSGAGARRAAIMRTDELLDAFKDMTLIELSEFVKQFEETFGVTAAAPTAATAATSTAGTADEASHGGEDSKFEVVLEQAGDKRIQVIKEVRALTGLGVKEAKDLVDEAPSVIARGVTAEEAERIRGALSRADANVAIRRAPEV